MLLHNICYIKITLFYCRKQTFILEKTIYCVFALFFLQIK